MREKIIQEIRAAKIPTADLTWPNVKKFVLKYRKAFNSEETARKWFVRIRKNITNTPECIPVKIASDSFAQYDKAADQYAFFPEQGSGLVGTFVVSGAKIRNICRSYSNITGASETVTKISRGFGIPRQAVLHIIKALGLTHDGLPWTNEELNEKSDDELIEDFSERRKFQIGQKIARKNYELLKKDADCWLNFKAGILDPFDSAIGAFSYTHPTTKVENNTEKSKGRKFAVALTDNHLGDIYKSSFNKDKFDAKIAANQITKLANDIKNSVSSRKEKFDSCELFVLGDFLNSFVDGMTRKGTHLHNELINEDLFDFGLNVLIRFTDEMVKTFGKVNFRAVKGNHGSLLEFSVYRCVEKAFRNDKRISFEITGEFVAHCKINNAFFMYSHGGADSVKFALPRGPKLEAYISNLILDNIDDMKDVKGRYFISGHTHAFKHEEMNNAVDFFVMSATVPATSHSRLLGFRNKPKATCLIIGKDYVEEVLHIHLN